MLSIIAVGDIMLGDHPVCFGHGVNSTIQKKGFHYLTRHVEPFLAEGDLVFGNLETVLSKPDDPQDLVEAELRGDPATAPALASAGFNVLNLANNHITQHGTAAIQDTLDALNQHGIQHIGLLSHGKNEEYTTTINGMSCTFIGYSLRPEKFLQPQNVYATSEGPEIIQDVTWLKANQPSSHIIVSLHWGEEYLNYPSKSQVDLAHQIIDSGASVIIGHHPHVLQGVEAYKHGIILYSLGNFIFDKWQRNSRQSAIANITITKSGKISATLTPVLITRQLYLLPVTGTRKKRALARLERFSEAITSAKHDLLLDGSDYTARAKRAYMYFRLQSYLYFILNLWRYTPKTISQSLMRFLARRGNELR